MNKTVSLGRALFLCLTLALFSASFTLSGCSVDSLSGPDLPAYSTDGTNNGGGTSGSADHNEGTDKTDGTNNGGGTSGSADHNEGTD